MKPHPRIRKTIKWGGAAVTVLLVVVWIGTGWYSVYWGCSDGQTSLYVEGGRALISWGGGFHMGDGFQLSGPTHNAQLLQPMFARGFGSSGVLAVPLWAPVLMVLAGSIAAWRLDTLARRRARLNLCPTCHYDRTGLAPGAACPECGGAAPV